MFQAVNTSSASKQTLAETARKALQLLRFDDFFMHFEKIAEPAEKKILLKEAISVAATHLKSAKLLAKLADVVAAEKFFEYPYLLVTVIEHLIQLEEYHTAIAIVVLYADKSKQSEELWSALCEGLLKNQQIEYVDTLYVHLKAGYKRQHIASQALLQIDSSKNLALWFKWFFRYLSDQSTIHYYSNAQAITQAFELATTYEPFSALLPILNVANPTPSQTQFLAKVCLHFLFIEDWPKAETFIQAMPVTLMWAKEIYQALNDEKFFHAFDHDWFQDHYLISSEMKEAFLNKALCTVFTQHQHDSLSDIETVLLQLFCKQKTYEKETLIDMFCTICLERQRHDIVLHLFINNIVKNNTTYTLHRLLDCQLENTEYQLILEKITPWPQKDIYKLAEVEEEHYSFYSAENVNLPILRKIPRQLVLAEHDRRYPNKNKKPTTLPDAITQDEKIRALANNSCFSRHDLHYSLLTKIWQHINDENFSEALFYTKKLVASKERDKYLKTISIGFGKNDQLALAKQASVLIQENSVIWKKWPQHIPNKNMKKTLDWLCSEKIYDIYPVIQLYIERLFEKKPEKEALEIVLQSQVLTHPNCTMDSIYSNQAKEGYFHNPSQEFPAQHARLAPILHSSVDLQAWRQYSVAGFILYYFIIHLSDTPIVFDKLKDLKERNITGFETALLYYYFANNAQIKAAELINIFDNKTSRDSHFKKTLINYFKFHAERSSENIKWLSYIKEEYTRNILLEIILSTWIPDSIFDDPDWEEYRESILKIINGFAEPFFKKLLMQKWLDKSQGKITLRLFSIAERIDDESIRLYFIKHCVFLSLLEPNEEIFYKASIYLKEDSALQFLIQEALKAKKGQVSTYFNLITHFLTIPEFLNHITQDIFKVIKQLFILSIMHSPKPLSIYLFLTDQRKHSNYAGDNQWDVNKFYLALEKIGLEQLTTLAQSNEELASSLIDYAKINAQTISVYREYIYPFREEEINIYLQQQLLNLLAKTLPHPFIDKFVKRVLNDISHPLAEFPSVFSSVFNNLREAKNYNLTAEIFLLISPFYYKSIEYVLHYLCEHWLLSKQYNNPLVFFKKLEEVLINSKEKPHQLYSIKSYYITRLIIELIKNNEYETAEQIYAENLNTASEKDIKTLLSYLLENEQLLFANRIINSHIRTTEHVIHYRQVILNKHFERLSRWIGKEYADKIKQTYYHLILFIKKNSQPATKTEANNLKNQIIPTIKNLLDKAFLAFYKETFQQEPPRKYLLCNFPSPVNEGCKGRTTQEKLDSFLKLFDMQSLQQSPFYSYLLTIQPADNPDYSWLAELRTMRNDETHAESYLPEKPVVNGKELDMQEYLPKAIKGIEEILIKLFQPEIKISQLNHLTLASVLPISIDTADSLEPYFKNTHSIPIPPSQPERSNPYLSP